MFLVVGANGRNLDILDTDDNVIETYSLEEVSAIQRLGVKIENLKIDLKSTLDLNDSNARALLVYGSKAKVELNRSNLLPIPFVSFISKGGDDKFYEGDRLSFLVHNLGDCRFIHILYNGYYHYVRTEWFFEHTLRCNGSGIMKDDCIFNLRCIGVKDDILRVCFDLTDDAIEISKDGKLLVHITKTLGNVTKTINRELSGVKMDKTYFRKCTLLSNKEESFVDFCTCTLKLNKV